jgi:uncharacterized protein (UPF0332 family)
MKDKKSLSKWRMEKAEMCLYSAKTLVESGDCYSAANRLYYCAFHCMRSVLALEGVDFKKHSAVIAYFREKYIKTALFEKRLSDILSKLFTVRTESDYDDFFIVNVQEITELVEDANYFLEQVKAYLVNRTETDDLLEATIKGDSE